MNTPDLQQDIKSLYNQGKHVITDQIDKFEDSLNLKQLQTPPKEDECQDTSKHTS